MGLESAAFLVSITLEFEELYSYLWVLTSSEAMWAIALSSRCEKDMRAMSPAQVGALHICILCVLKDPIFPASITAGQFWP